MHSDWVKRTKWLIQLLILSVTINIGLIASFAYFALREKKETITFQTDFTEKKSETFFSNQEILRTFSALSYSELAVLLQDRKLVEEGFTKRDLALACLVAFHHFNIDRALGGVILQKRALQFTSASEEEMADLIVFPGLAEYQYQAITKYAKTEKWPFTSQGIFCEIKKTRAPRDPSLLEAFFLTPEFYSVITLFHQGGLRIDKEVLVEMVATGEWEVLFAFGKDQQIVPDFSPQRRRSFLLEYLKRQSKVAAMLLVQTDREFVSKRLDDQEIISILELSSGKTTEMEAFLKDLLQSPRSDQVLKKAAKKLYYFSGEMMPEPYDHISALHKFVPASVLKKNMDAPAKILIELPPKLDLPVKAEVPVKPTKSKKRRTHVVQNGESLWKISRKYKVSIEDLMKVNHLETEKLRVGKEIEIP